MKTEINNREIYLEIKRCSIPDKWVKGLIKAERQWLRGLFREKDIAAR